MSDQFVQYWIFRAKDQVTSRRPILNPEDTNSPDDIIPRCMSGGYPLSWCTLSTNLKDLHELENSFFRERVIDAIIRLSKGEDREEIKQIHGGIVLRQATILARHGK